MKQFIAKYNLLLFVPLVVIMIASFFCMFEVRFIKDIYATHLTKQILWFMVGFLIIIILQKIKVKFLFHYSFYIYLLGNVLLLLVLFFGKEINGAKAWFHFKFLNFQPSEFMKVALLLYLSKVTNDFKMNGKKREIGYILKCILITLIPCLLIFLEPDTGAIILYLLLLLSVLLLSGIKKRWFIIAFFLLMFLGSGFIYLYFCKQDLLVHWMGTNLFYRMDRLINFKEGNGMQLNNALITIGNAGVFGHGIQKNLLYVPEFPTDFVFTLFLSIFGFLGGLLLLCSFFTLNYYFINKLFSVTQMEKKCFIHGFLFLFLFQQIQNIFMNLGLMPIMGIPLPFLSYGGSNMIVYFIFIGIILKITKNKSSTLKLKTRH